MINRSIKKFLFFSTGLFGRLTFGLLCYVLFGWLFCSCSDDVDDSNLYSFKGETISGYLQKNAEFSDYCYILSKVKLSKKTSSTLMELLSTRGNYTCFAPTNEAIQQYLDSVYETPHFNIENITDSIAEDIAKNSLIDNENADAYQTSDFIEGALGVTNMNDRYITVKFVAGENGKVGYKINNLSTIINPNIEAENGYIHSIDRVLAASNVYLPTVIEQAPNMQIFALLLKETGWADSMLQYRDEHYEQNKPESAADGSSAKVPEHRYIGYTALTEPDEVFEQEWGIAAPIVENGFLMNKEQILSQVKAKCQEVYPLLKGSDLTKEDNAVNYFVSYHLLPERITYDKLVIHYAEIGYSYKNPTKLSINCTETYETISKKNRRLLQFTEGKTTDGIRINRSSTYDRNSYDELTVERPGLKVSPSNGNYEFNALNGFYYPIDGVLLYDDYVKNVILNSRIRFDISALLPELMTNGIRKMASSTTIFIPAGYFADVESDEKTYYRYLPSYGLGYPNYQGDEHNIQGAYDFIMKLPPVPYEGTWELRWSVPIFPNRGMAQIYLGKNKDNLPAIGLPLDLRLYADNPTIGWKADTDDPETNREIDKSMRSHGYMKPVAHDGPTTGGVVSASLRDQSSYQRLRRILYTGNVGPKDVLYLRIKSVLSNTSTMFVMDHMEWAPKSVYAGATEEDKW